MKDALLEISGKFLMGKKDASFTTGQGDGNGKLEKYIQMMERGSICRWCLKKRMPTACCPR